ncbi:MAG TPA: PQQ-binding-like beta-propeller repeat protein [Actinomycetota bacterium]
MVHGRGFRPTEIVDLTFDADALGSATTDPSGAFQTRIQIPASALPGLHEVQATGESSRLTAQAPFIVNTDWAMFHFGPARTGFNPVENVLDPSNVSGLHKAWKFHAVEYDASVAVVDGVVYVAGTALDALDARTGATVWSVDFGDLNYTVSSPAVAYGIVYVCLPVGVFALNAETGAQVWAFSTDNRIDASPAVADGVVYVPSFDGNLYALDAATGTPQWTLRTGAFELSNPAVANGVVYWGSANGTLYALDGATGATLWTARVPVAGLAGPAVSHGVVYVEGADGTIYALDAATGHKRWAFPTPGVIEASPAVANGVVYAAGGYGDRTSVYALDADTGVKLWTASVFHNHPTASPVVANGVLYVASPSGRLAALDSATGAKLWLFPAGGATYSSVAVANGMVYLASQKGATFAFGL